MSISRCASFHLRFPFRYMYNFSLQSFHQYLLTLFNDRTTKPFVTKKDYTLFAQEHNGTLRLLDQSVDIRPGMVLVMYALIRIAEKALVCCPFCTSAFSTPHIRQHHKW